MLARYDAPDSDSGGSEDATDSSSCGSQSSSPSIKSTSKVISRMRSLDLNHVLCMDTAEDGDLSQAAANGKSRDRILLAMKKPCCRRRCKRHLNFKLVLTFCVAFWSLSKAGQDNLLLGIMFRVVI